MAENRNIVYDILLLEAERVQRKRKKDLDLYYKNHLGDIVPIAQGYDKEVDDIVGGIFKKRKMRYLMTFVDAIDLQDDLKPSSHKVLRYFTKKMSYGNTLKNIGTRDINEETGINMKYVLNAIKELCDKDILRFTVEKGRRTYIVNPVYFYKGTLRSIFKVIRSFDNYPKRDASLEVITKQ